jgi:hypothetical protein
MTLLAVIMVVVLVLAVFLIVPRRKTSAAFRNGTHTAVVGDADELARAEKELAELDAMATPNDAVEDLPDWGPGAPKYRRDAS